MIQLQRGIAWTDQPSILPMLGWEFLLTLQLSWFRCMLLFEINPAEVLILISDHGCAGYKCPWARRSL
jgi:hypothetical protein